MQAVLRSGLLLFFPRLLFFGGTSCREAHFKCVQDGRNMVYELGASGRGRGSELWIRIDSASPCVEDGVAPIK
jgi:hypothetical protein